MKYKLKIDIVNKTFIVKGRPVRTPVIIENLSKNELERHLSKIKFEGIRDDDFQIEEMVDSSKPKISISKRKPNQNEKELETNNKKSILDQYLYDD